MQRATAVLSEDTISDNIPQARRGVDSVQAFKITVKNQTLCFMCKMGLTNFGLRW